MENEGAANEGRNGTRDNYDQERTTGWRVVVVVVGLFTHAIISTFVYHTLTGMFQKSIYKYVQNLQDDGVWPSTGMRGCVGWWAGGWVRGKEGECWELGHANNRTIVSWSFLLFKYRVKNKKIKK